MGAITRQIERYRAGRLSFLQLRDWLTAHTYADHEIENPEERDPVAREQLDPIPYQENTWDEVYRAFARGLLTDNEFTAINAAVYAAHHPKQPGGPKGLKPG